MTLLRHRQRTPDDPDAIWRGEVPDGDIVMTAAERAEIERERQQRRRRSLVALFGEPVGALSYADGSFQHARRGEARRGASIDQNRTAGCREEIQVTLLGHPVSAAEVIDDDGVLDALDRLRVDHTSRTQARKQITWDARLRTAPWSARSVRLRLYGSPSSNVTVLTLTPHRSRRLGVRRFLRVGLDSLGAIRDRAESGLPTTP